MFLNNPLVVIAPPHHPLTKQHNIPLSVLANEAFILREEGSGTRMMAERFFAAQGIRPRVKLNLGSNEAIKEAVAGGLGCAVLSHHAVAAYRIDGSIAVLDVEGFPIQSQWFTVTLHGKRLGPIAAMFRNDLREMSKEISASFKF
jgi:DNA-binding transcriptional LysR family regulator